MKKKYNQTLSANGYFINDKLKINPNLQSLQDKNTYRLKIDETELNFYADRFRYVTHDEFEHDSYSRTINRIRHKYGGGGESNYEIDLHKLKIKIKSSLITHKDHLILVKG